MGGLSLSLFGPFQARLDGEPLGSFHSSKVQALLVYLTVEQANPHRREKLMTMLWPGMPERSARSNLRNTLYQLRRLIEGEDEVQGTPTFVLSDRQNIRFNHDFDLVLDVTRFEVLLNEYQTHNHNNPLECSRCHQSLEEAASIYQGSFLSDFYLEDSNPFEDWAAAKRQDYEQQALDTLESLTAIYIHQANWEQAKTYAQRQLAIDNLRESAHRQFMEILARMGRRTEAIRHYEELSVLLNQELGVLPSDQTQALYQAILAGQLPTPQETQKPIAVQPPFKGLQPFEVADANLFFGRETLIAELVERLHRSSFLAVVGASGSGKSSLVRAGLIPALLAGNQPSSSSNIWKTVILTPTGHPIENLAASMTLESESVTATTTLIDDLMIDPRSLHLYARKLLFQHHTDHLVLVVDQFEELFTLCHDEVERITFINNLVTAGDGGLDQPTKVVIILRADFYTQCVRYPDLRALLETHQSLIGPMTYQELRRAIEEPALQKGFDFEPGLVDLFLRDVGAGIDSQPEPGALPLISHALLETWRHRQGHTMTLQAYHQIGGVIGAIAQTAEVVYNQQLTFDQQAIARKIFLQLTELGEDTPDTRRRTSLESLNQRVENEVEVAEVVKTLADARLITTSKGTVEIAHEALIREWPRLREWLEANRADIREQRILARAAAEWTKANRDPSFLLRGTRLDHYAEWKPTASLALTPDEHDFLEISLADRDARRAARFQEQATRQRIQRRFNLGMTLLTLIALFLSALAILQWVVAKNEARVAFVRELSAAALNNLRIDPELSVLLALHAVAQTQDINGAATSESEQALHLAVQASHVRFSVPGDGNIGPATFSPDGKQIAIPSEDGSINILDANNSEELLRLSLETFRFISMLAFNPNGTQLGAVIVREQSDLVDITIWNLDTNTVIRKLETRDDWYLPKIQFSPDGSKIAIFTPYILKIIDSASGELLDTYEGGQPVLDVVGSLDSTSWNAVFEVEGAYLMFWHEKPWAFSDLIKNTGGVYSVLFNPDGSLLATSSELQKVNLWNTNTGQKFLTLPENEGRNPSYRYKGRTTDFSQDGKKFAMINQLGQIIIWDLETKSEVYRFTCVPFAADFDINPEFSSTVVTDANGLHKVCDTFRDHEAFISTIHANEVNNVAFNSDGTRLVSGGNYRDGVMVWDLTNPTESNFGRNYPYISIPGQSPTAFSLDGTRILTGDPAGPLREWDLDSGEVLRSWKGGTINTASYSPDGKRLLVGNEIGFVTMYDLENDQELFRVMAMRRQLITARFSPDGQRFATAGNNAPIKIWDADTGEELLSLGDEQNYQDIAFSPDGQYLATGTLNGQILIWDSLAGGEPLSFGSDEFGQVMAIAYTPDGKRLVTGGLSGQVGVWDAENRQRSFTLASLQNAVLDVAVSEDGRYLATGSEDGTVRVFLLDLNELIELARTRVTRGFTQEECQEYLHMDSCPELSP